jgi:cell division septation protein DedD
MARFNFGKRAHRDDEGIPPEPVEGDIGGEFERETIEHGSRVRRPLMIAAVGIVVVGGIYLANVLFFSAPPPPAPSVPVRPAAPAPPPSPPATPLPAKDAAVPPAQAPAKTVLPETKGEAKTPPPAAAPKVEAPVKVAAPSKPDAKPATKEPPPVKATAPSKQVQPAPKVEAKTPAKGVGPAATGFSVQVGAMAQQTNAEQLKRRLDGMGYEAVIRKGSGFASGHIVTVGDPAGKPEAEELARRLNVDGFPSRLVAAEGKYVLQIGSFVNLDEAIDVARELQKKNYRPKITSKPATTVLYQVRHGQFDTRAAAIKRGEELKAKGFSAWVVPN